MQSINSIKQNKSALWIFVLKFVGCFALFMILFYGLDYLFESFKEKWIQLCASLVSFYFEIYSESHVVKIEAHKFWVYKGDLPAVSVVQSCTAYNMMALYCSFILAISNFSRNSLIWSVAGVCVLYLLNGFRVLLLGEIFLNYPELFDFCHDYLFYVAEYGLVLLGWWTYLKSKENEQSTDFREYNSGAQ